MQETKNPIWLKTPIFTKRFRDHCYWTGSWPLSLRPNRYLNLNNRGSKIEQIIPHHWRNAWHFIICNWKKVNPNPNITMKKSPTIILIYCYFSLSHLNTFDHITHYGKTGDRHGSHCKLRASCHDVLNLGLDDCCDPRGGGVRNEEKCFFNVTLGYHESPVYYS